MLKLLRKIYSKQKLIRSIELDRLMQITYAHWLSFRKKGPIFTVFTEISSKCNLSCDNCYRTHNEYSAKNFNMSFNTFKKVVDELPSGIQYLVTQGFGESASNPDLKRMLKYASDSKKFGTIILDSNLLLKDVAFYQSLFTYGLDRLIISVDSFEQSICDQLRLGTDIHKLTQNLTKISKSNPEQVHVRITVSKINLDDFENTLKTLVNMHIDRVEIGLLRDFHNKGNALNEQEEDRAISIIKKFEKKINILFNKHHICTLPFTAININAKGNIMPCCMIFDDEIIHYGNINSGLKNTYYSKAFNNLRSTFYKEKPSFCKHCPYYKN